MQVLKMAIKAADLTHCTRPVRIHRMWVENITEEFHRQGDLEKEMGMQVSPGMDRVQFSGPIQQVNPTTTSYSPSPPSELFLSCSKYVSGKLCWSNCCFSE